jgi:hypothetical protein
MPNRIIKDSISKSEAISGLTDFQFRLWVHLITYVDDYGRGDARPAIIKGACFPFRDRLTNKDIEKGLADLAGAGCVVLYKVDGKPYLYFPNWEQHQRVRQKVSKCPSPDDCDDMQQVAASCGELPQDAARIQNPESESRIQNPESRTNARKTREEDFELFWDAYPRHEGKQKARSAFEKVNVPLQTLLDAVAEHKRSSQWSKDNGQYIPHAATWLNGKRWEDKLTPEKGSYVNGKRQLDAYEVESIRRMMNMSTDEFLGIDSTQDFTEGML